MKAPLMICEAAGLKSESALTIRSENDIVSYSLRCSEIVIASKAKQSPRIATSLTLLAVTEEDL